MERRFRFFYEKNNSWTAVVGKNLPEDSETLPVCFEQGWSIQKLSNYSRDQQKKLIHIEHIPKIGAIVYVGRVGLPGGGAGASYQGYKPVANPEAEKKYFKCLKCGAYYESSNDQVNQYILQHSCNTCNACLVIRNKCRCNLRGVIARHCNQCCDRNKRLVNPRGSSCSTYRV